MTDDYPPICTKCDGKGFILLVIEDHEPLRIKWRCLACRGTGIETGIETGL